MTGDEWVNAVDALAAEMHESWPRIRAPQVRQLEELADVCGRVDWGDTSVERAAVTWQRVGWLMAQLEELTA